MLTKPFNYICESSRQVDNKINILPNKHTRHFSHIKIHDEQIGYVGLMCPRCFNFDIITIHNKVSYINTQYSLNNKEYVTTVADIKYKLKCPVCSTRDYFIEIDPNIVEAISLLNKKGYHTKYCCEGHKTGTYHNGYIYFKSDDISKYLHTLPLTWYLDTYSDIPYMGDGCIIRAINSPYKDEAIRDISEWVETLPYNVKSLYQKTLLNLCMKQS